MNIFWNVFTWFGCLVSVASATSFSPEDSKCPVCGKASVDTVMMSYSNFGHTPARDRIFSSFGASVRICPHDLYASWTSKWDDLKPGDKESLTALLKNPGVVLTDRERQIIGTRIDALRKSSWWGMMWARTCDSVRKPDAKHARFTAVRFYQAGDIDSPEPWIRELTQLYRDQAVEALENSKQTGDRFQRAELLRLSGRKEESTVCFQALAADLGKVGPDSQDDDISEEDRGILKGLCEEGLILIEADGVPSEKIAEWLIQSFPLPDRGESPPAGWSRHRIALQILVDRTEAGDQQAGELLLKALANDARRILALDETLENIPGAPDVAELRKCDDPWTTWFNGLAEDANAGKLPDSLKSHPNRERCLNILKSYGPPSFGSMDEDWQKHTLLPAVIKADQNGKLPDLSIPRDDLALALVGLVEQDVEDREAVLRTMVRVFQDLPEPDDAPEYGFRVAFVTLAERLAKANAPVVAIDGGWKSRWWKLAVRYAAGQPVGPELVNERSFSISFEDDEIFSDHRKHLEVLVYHLFAVRRDPIWKTKIIGELESAPWLPDESIDYAQSLGDKEVDAALEARVIRLRNKEIQGADERMSLYEILHVEERDLKVRMAMLPVR